MYCLSTFVLAWYCIVTINPQTSSSLFSSIFKLIVLSGIKILLSKHIFSNVINSKVFQLGIVRLLRTSGKFGQTFANGGNSDEVAPYEPSHQDFHCLLIYFFHSNN